MTAFGQGPVASRMGSRIGIAVMGRLDVEDVCMLRFYRIRGWNSNEKCLGNEADVGLTREWERVDWEFAGADSRPTGFALVIEWGAW